MYLLAIRETLWGARIAHDPPTVSYKALFRDQAEPLAEALVSISTKRRMNNN